MKKILLLFLLLPQFIHAQTENPLDNIFIGVQAGLNISDFLDPIHFRNDSFSNSSRLTLPLIGVNTTIPFNNYLNLRIGAAWSAKGTLYTSPEYYKIKYNYIDFPLGLQVKTWDFLRLEAGLVPSLLINSKALFHANGDSVVQLPVYGSGMEIAFKLGAEISLQKGLDFGFAYEFPSNSSSFKNIRLTLTYSFRTKVFEQPKKNNDDIAYQQIIDLHNNVLLVRLQTSELQINALKKKGRLADAENLYKKQYQRNKEIVAAFKSQFNFCPVYFFYSSATSDIKQKIYNGHLLNDSLQPDSTITISYPSVYIVEFGAIDPDTIYVDRDLTQQKTYRSDTSYTLSNTRQTEALLIRNANFVQLREPFPYYVKMDDWIKRRSYLYVVSSFNNNLHSFFKMAMQSGTQ